MNANQIKGTSGNAIQIQFGGALLSGDQGALRGVEEEVIRPLRARSGRRRCP